MESQQTISFTKMHGSGNDFVVIRRSDLDPADVDFAEFTRKLCRRGTSVGADGVIIISPSDVADFHWRYINADGSDGELCGNGAMVGARFTVEEGIAARECRFETEVGIIEATVDGAHVDLSMVDAQFIEDGLIFDELPEVEFDHLLMGVPHVVGFVDDADAVSEFATIGRKIRQDEQIQPAGANVNLVHRIDDNSIRMRTYERGVEAETLACGTGAVSCSIAAVQRGLVNQPVTVRVSSGMELSVSWQQKGSTFTEIRLGGTARVVARGEIEPEAFA